VKNLAKELEQKSKELPQIAMIKKKLLDIEHPRRGYISGEYYVEEEIQLRYSPIIRFLQGYDIIDSKIYQLLVGEDIKFKVKGSSDYKTFGKYEDNIEQRIIKNNLAGVIEYLNDNNMDRAKKGIDLLIPKEALTGVMEVKVVNPENLEARLKLITALILTVNDQLLKLKDSNEIFSNYTELKINTIFNKFKSEYDKTTLNQDQLRRELFTIVLPWTIKDLENKKIKVPEALQTMKGAANLFTEIVTDFNSEPRPANFWILAAGKLLQFMTDINKSVELFK
jgi:hypothetical protein